MPAAATKGKAPAANGSAAPAAAGKGAGKKGAGGGEKAKSKAPAAESSSATASGTATPTTTAASESLKGGAAAAAGGSGGKFERPSREKYDAEQNALRAEIDAKEAQRRKIDEQISGANAGGSSAERKKELQAERDELRSNKKTSRSTIFDAMNAKKQKIEDIKKEIQNPKVKLPAKSSADLEAQIKHLEKQVDSATMKIADEKRALQEMSNLKKFRKPLEEFHAKQEEITKLQAEVDEIRKQLDDPELKKADEHAKAVDAELDEIKKNENENRANNNKLHDQRRALKAELDALYARKRESRDTFQEANNRYRDKVNADRQKRQEQFKAQRKKEEDEKKRAVALQMREEAELPAFQEEIEDCQTLIDFFAGKGTGVKERADPTSSKVAIVGVPELELRQVETAPAAGFVQFKKKGDDEDVYFAGTKGKGKGKKNGGKAKPNGTAAADAATNGDAAPSTPSSDKLHVPLATLRALMKMSIPPPSSPADVPRTVEDLKTKKAWFEANQDRVTKEKIAKAEAQIQKLSTEEPASVSAKDVSKSGSATPATPASELLPPNGTGENPAEPIPTPLATDSLSVGVESEKVDEVLDEVHQVQTEEVAAES